MMPPGPAYNWLCVLHSTAEILSHAARYRASQIVPRSTTSSPLNSRKRRRTEDSETVDNIILPVVNVDHARSAEEKSSGREPVVNASSITQNVGIQVCEITYSILKIIVPTCLDIQWLWLSIFSRILLQRPQHRYQKNLLYIRQSFKTQIHRRR